ncbi:MAG: hypothetical protein COA58_04760 [Bacteroidetes bacterium]|nr:MAG: hypothetical protein COA58_04760 [Bacteroidota bacterium]
MMEEIDEQIRSLPKFVPYRMRKLVLLFFCFVFMGSYAQDMEAIIKGEKEAFISKRNFKSKRSGQAYDIVYHKLKLNIDPAVRNIFGSVYSELVAGTDGFSQFSFDLDSRMIVDSILYEGTLANFTHSGDEILITIPSLNKGALVAVEVFYSGNPSVNEQRGFSYDFQKDGPIAWSLSEPYGAYGWWPCKQQLNDKIDSIDFEITIPKNNKAASLGLLQKVDTLADSSLVYYWKHRYPVTTYLVAVAVTNYYEESHYIHLSDGDSLYHLDYLYPAYKEQADTLRWKINGMMRGFDSLFGDYPFRNEKYGHAMFARGGGMEHQTMSFMSNLDFDLMAHELAHQWFGDKVTCGSWQDLWLNESWATYSNAIARELVLSREEFLAFLIESRSRATRNNDGSVFAYDTTDVGDLFNGDMRYRKGSMVLHQLRWELGDSDFFQGTRDYLANADLCYGFAKTIDFREAMEAASGKDLYGFFDRYVYQEGFPQVLTRWSRQSHSKVKLEISQTTSHSSVEFFPLTIQYRASEGTQDTTFLIEHTSPNQEIELELGMHIESLVFDPNVWLLAKGSVIEGDHLDLSTISLYPNPSSSSISLYMKDRKVDEVFIIDIQGRVVRRIDAQSLKSGITEIDIQDLSNGIYFLKATDGTDSAVLRFSKTSL